jgi:uncharacterized protein (DUF952 family)
VSRALYFHITTRAALAKARQDGAYRPPSLETEGFVHLSLERQWQGAANRFYRGQPELVLLVLAAELLDAPVRFEAADGDRFPHLFGAVPVSAILAALDLPLTADGQVLEPDGFSAVVAAHSA